MTSTTARHPLKPKTLTLLELCQSIKDFRNPVSAMTSPNSASLLTRRVYLHPLILNPNPSPNSKQQSLKSTSVHSLPHMDSDHRALLNSDKHREAQNIKNKTSFNGLAVLSSSAPLATRMNAKYDTRHLRDRQLLAAEDDVISDFDISTTSICLNQPSIHSLARGTTSSTHAVCTRPTCVLNHQKAYAKSQRWEKLDVWYNIDQALQRPMPNNPPTTPLNISTMSNENDDMQEQSSSFQSIQEIKIYKRNPNSSMATNQPVNNDDDDDSYDYDYVL